MNALQQQVQDPQRLQFEADLATRVAALFGRCPALAGFTLFGPGAEPLDLTFHPAQQGEHAEEVFEEVEEMLSELAGEQPEAAVLLHGRTFARNLH